MDRISVKDGSFIDSFGRVRIFHGVNLVCKDKSRGYVGGWDRQDFDAMRKLGLNLVRLGFLWDGLEPEPGRYNEAYLDRMEGLLDLCAEFGMYVLLDMHQDLYGARFSDGAPDWATLTDGLPEPEEGQVWSDAYLSSAAVQRAFDHFWANDAANDGIGLQDHLAGCWRRIAQRFGGRPEVLGYDFINEPFPGTAALPIFGSLLASFSQLEAQALNRPSRTMEETAALFADKQNLLEALSLLDDDRRYRSFVKAAAPLAAEFDTEKLARFYESMAAAVRAETNEGILFLENNYFSNLGVPSCVQPIAPDGARESRQAYAPHGYDLVVDTPFVGSGASENRAGVIFGNHRATQQRLDVPVLVGEWGGFGEHEDIEKHSLFLLDTFDKYCWSFAYWEWRAGESGKTTAIGLLARPYPKAVEGNLKSFRYDQASGRFELVWENSASLRAPTVVCLPGDHTGRRIEADPGCRWEMKDMEGVAHIVIDSAQNGRHRLTIR